MATNLLHPGPDAMDPTVDLESPDVDETVSPSPLSGSTARQLITPDYTSPGYRAGLGVPPATYQNPPLAPFPGSHVESPGDAGREERPTMPLIATIAYPGEVVDAGRLQFTAAGQVFSCGLVNPNAGAPIATTSIYLLCEYTSINGTAATLGVVSVRSVTAGTASRLPGFCLPSVQTAGQCRVVELRVPGVQLVCEDPGPNGGLYVSFAVISSERFPQG